MMDSSSQGMKRFTWRLQRVLDVKTKEEQIKRTELFRLTEQLAATRGELLVRRRILQGLLAGIRRDAPQERVGSQEFLLRHASVDEERIRRLLEDIAALEARHRDKTAEVLAARRFREALEKLKVQAKEQHLREQERLEQKELDERTTVAFAQTSGTVPSGASDRTPCGVTTDDQEHNR
jgi:flagellar biosynthesis chaperone FliJ